ncbi:hypothetical protein [Amycolatopsis sp. NPDC003861]
MSAAPTGASARTPVTLPVARVVIAAPSHWPWYPAAMLSMIGTNALDPSTDSFPVAHCADSAGRDHETSSVASKAPVSSTPTAVVTTGQVARRCLRSSLIRSARRGTATGECSPVVHRRRSNWPAS